MTGIRGAALVTLNLIVGVGMIVVALVLHLVLPGLPFALMILGGLLLVLNGLNKR